MASGASLDIVFRVEEVGELRGVLKRYLAPMTFDSLVRQMPLSGALVVSGGLAYFQISVKRGAEKEVRRVEPGDILYWPALPALAIILEPTTPPSQSVKIGMLTDSPQPLKNARQGLRIVLDRATWT
jgi:hypothetical protein